MENAGEKAYRKDGVTRANRYLESHFCKLGKNESVTMETIDKICTALGVPISDVVEIVGKMLSADYHSSSK